MNHRNTVLPIRTLILASLLLPAMASAEWKSDIEGSAVLQGQTKGTKLRFKATNDTRPFSQVVYADWIRGDNSSNTYEIGYEPKYWLGDKLYLFGDASMQQAKSLQIDREIAAQGGAGIQLLQTDITQISVEAGMGRTITEFTDENDKLERDVSSVSANATTLLTEFLKLNLTADYNKGEVITQRTVEAALSLSVVGGAIKYSYQIENIDSDDTDSIEQKSSSVSYSYSF